MVPKNKKFFSDIVWSVFALAVMHGVLQIAVYPYLNKKLGAGQFGTVLYVLAILGILAPSIGLSANNVRLIKRNEIRVENGDFLLAMLPQFLVAATIFSAILIKNKYGTFDIILLLITLGLTLLRSYGDVEYRMSLNYKGYFLYYLFISAGYLLGIILFPLAESWILCFLLGELFCTLFLIFRGHVYWPIAVSENRKLIFNSALILSGSYLLNNMVLYLDRILLQNLMDSASVTIFYVSSLLGKTAALLIGPLNGVIIGHLTKAKSQITLKLFIKAAGSMMALGTVLYGGIMIVTPLFARIFYPEISETVLVFAWIANLSQILCFIASPLLTIMLTFCSSRWQLIIQAIYAAVFILLTILGTEKGGLLGFIWAGLTANAARLTFVSVIGFVEVKRTMS